MSAIKRSATLASLVAMCAAIRVDFPTTRKRRVYAENVMPGGFCRRCGGRVDIEGRDACTCGRRDAGEDGAGRG